MDTPSKVIAEIRSSLARIRTEELDPPIVDLLFAVEGVLDLVETLLPIEREVSV